MLLRLFTASCLLFGSSVAIQTQKLCYGRDLKFPYRYRPPLFNGAVYFTPSTGGVESMRVIMDKGEAKEPRIRISYSSFVLRDLRESDAGTYSVSAGDSVSTDIIKLIVTECAEEIEEYYGGDFVFDIPGQAELLEFTPLNSVDQPKVLWNRASPDTYDRGRVNVKWNAATITVLTLADNGFYNLRKKDNTLIWRKRLTVKGTFKRYDAYEKSSVIIPFPSGSSAWTVTFKPEYDSNQEVLVRDGRVVREGGTYQESFDMRLYVTRNRFEIHDLQIGDSGVFEVTDKNGHLVLTAHLAVDNQPAHPLIYVGAGVGFLFFVLICGLCLKRCCCKNGCCKKDVSRPAMQHQYQSSGPTYSAAPVQASSYQPVNPRTYREPATTSAGPSVFTPVNVHTKPTQPMGTGPAGQGSTPTVGVNSDFLSSDSEPRFELKGIDFASAPPLSSDSTLSNVYNSDKLNSF